MAGPLRSQNRRLKRIGASGHASVTCSTLLRGPTALFGVTSDPARGATITSRTTGTGRDFTPWRLSPSVTEELGAPSGSFIPSRATRSVTRESAWSGRTRKVWRLRWRQWHTLLLAETPFGFGQASPDRSLRGHIKRHSRVGECAPRPPTGFLRCYGRPRFGAGDCLTALTTSCRYTRCSRMARSAAMGSPRAIASSRSRCCSAITLTTTAGSITAASRG